MVRIIIIGTLTAVGLAQVPAPTVKEAGSETPVAISPSKSAGASVAPGEAVLTVHGVCTHPQSSLSVSPGDCTVVVQRQQFDALLKIVAPAGQLTESVKHSVAETYANLVAFNIAAQKSGIANSAQFQESMEWSRLRMAADLYRRNLEKEFSAVSEEEIDNYYREHISEFEEAKLRRMLVPRSNPAVSDKQEWERRALELASAFRDRAANGEDLEQLQKEAYVAAGLNNLPPATEIGTRRRSGLTSDVSEDVFALRPGEVGKVEKEPYSFVVYKVESKRTLPKERVREEISREIAKRKLDAALQSISASVRIELNEDYFGAPQDQ